VQKISASRLQEIALRICSARRESRHRLDLSVPPVFLCELCGKPQALAVVLVSWRTIVLRGLE
jgi:hypothetical protein